MTPPNKLRKRVPGYLYFGKESHAWGFPDPADERLEAAAHDARYYPSRLHPDEAMRLATFVEACRYLLVDCPTTEQAIEKLRAIRRAAKDGGGK